MRPDILVGAVDVMNTVRRCTETCAWERSNAAFGADTIAGVGGTWSRSRASRSAPLSGG